MCPKRLRTLSTIVERSTEEEAAGRLNGENGFGRLGATLWVNNFLREIGGWGIGIGDIIENIGIMAGGRGIQNHNQMEQDFQHENPEFGEGDFYTRFAQWIQSFPLIQALISLDWSSIGSSSLEYFSERGRSFIRSAKAYHAENPMMATALFTGGLLMTFLLFLPFLLTLGIFLAIEGTILTVFLAIFGGILLSVGGILAFLGVILLGGYHLTTAVRSGELREGVSTFLGDHRGRIESFLVTLPGGMTILSILNPLFEALGLFPKTKANGSGKNPNGNLNGNGRNGINGNGASRNGGVLEVDSEDEEDDDSLAHTD